MKVVAKALRKSDEQQSATASAAFGAVSKIIASVATYPYQLIKSKLQQRAVFNVELQRHELKYTGLVDCARKVWRQEGMVGFFRGVLPNSLKVAPSSAVTFLVYEECMKYFRYLERSQR